MTKLFFWTLMILISLYFIFHLGRFYEYQQINHSNTLINSSNLPQSDYVDQYFLENSIPEYQEEPTSTI